MKSSIILTITAIMFACCCTNAKSIDNKTVDKLELSRYLGTWYEIAKFDHSFEKGVEFAKAVYSLQEDGKVRVENSGIKNGKPKMSVGKAFLPDPAKEPARLRVSFFGPFYSDYRVMMLTEDYQYALVGSSSPKYLWILSRTPHVPTEMLNAILAEAQRRGYDTNRLIWVKQ